ncbi:hypothetical protein BUALT_Bualt05G0092300 [Buddleja alternifolia]|uniref:Mitochondrial import inner membrane translocase subunit n=1 Tax=Buddleja alternifolia TaxID=168488 RepID=A0AAV6XQM4_9LAMI|nr:hypothetical protein BUALT_Bualt05G0092300 [Buddleja alternifolia]
MDSFSSPSSGASPKISSDDLMDQLKTQLAQAYAEEFLERMGHRDLFLDYFPKVMKKEERFYHNCNAHLETVRGKCFDKCITKPGSSLSGGESSCISRCVERYIEATGIIGRALFNQR